MIFKIKVQIFFSTIFCSLALLCLQNAVHANESVKDKISPGRLVSQQEIAPNANCGYMSGQPFQPSSQQALKARSSSFLQEQQEPVEVQQQQQPPRAQNAGSLKPSLQLQQPSLYKKADCGPSKEGYTVNFENISVIQLIQFISKISGTNFIFNSEDLQFNITIVSEDQTSVTDLSAALLQILKMHNLSVTEQGNNVLIYKNQNMSKVSRVITDDNVSESCDTAVITRVFQLYNVQAEKIAAIVRTLVSPEANVEPSIETRHLIVTDITANVNKIADLLSALDTPSLAVDVAEYTVQSANAATLAEYAREILMPMAGGINLNITPEPTSQKIFIVATPFIINKALQILSSLDVPEITSLNPLPPGLSIENNNFYMYKLKHQNGQDIAAALREVGTNLQYTGVANIDFVNAIYSIQWMDVNNSIVITGTDNAIKKVLNLLEELDQLPKQVYIEVLVLDTALENSLDFGVQWIALGDEQNKLAFASGLLGAPGSVPILEGTPTTNPGARFIAANNNPNTVPPRPPLIPNPGRDVALPNPSLLNGIIPANFTEAFGLGIIGNVIRHNGQSFLTLGALLSALDEESDVTVVLNPRVMVEDTQAASFFVGQNIPYQTTSTVIQQTGSVTQNIQYEDIGIQLQVTPIIAPDNMVTLQINQTVATLATAVGVLTPTTNKTLSTTRVHVPDGTFLVMSGQITDRCDYIRSGIPCLGSLPLIGPAFSRTIEQRRKRNLIFFIRPKVITNIDEGIILTNEEGYNYNWDSNPCSIIEKGCEKAPECEIYPNPCWPPMNPFTPPSLGPTERYPIYDEQPRRQTYDRDINYPTDEPIYYPTNQNMGLPGNIYPIESVDSYESMSFPPNEYVYPNENMGLPPNEYGYPNESLSYPPNEGMFPYESFPPNEYMYPSNENMNNPSNEYLYEGDMQAPQYYPSQEYPVQSEQMGPYENPHNFYEYAPASPPDNYYSP